jgi:hypothetical protein
MTANAETPDRFARGTVDDLCKELDRLREDNADLRASALLWRRLYERALTVAGEAGSSVLPGAAERPEPLRVDVSLAHGAHESVAALFTVR